MKRTILFIGILTYVMLLNAKQWISFDGTSLPISPKITVICSDDIQTILDVEFFGYYIEKQYINNGNILQFQFLDYQIHYRRECHQSLSLMRL